MKPPTLLLAITLFAGCAGDNYVTRESPTEPARGLRRISAANEVRQPVKRDGQFIPGRTYLITRLETTDERRGEWRALGETIRQRGTDIDFVELGSGRTVSFNSPHQITPTDVRGDRPSVQFTNEEPNHGLDDGR